MLSGRLPGQSATLPIIGMSLFPHCSYLSLTECFTEIDLPEGMTYRAGDYLAMSAIPHIYGALV